MPHTRRLFPYLRPYLLLILLAPLMMVGEVAMDLVQPRLMQRIIDEGIARNDLNEVLRTTGLMVGLAFLGAIFGVLCGVFAVRASLEFATDLRGVLFRKVQAFSFGNLDKLESGGLITRLTNDVVQLTDAVQMMLRITVRAPLLLIGAIAMAVMTAPKLSWVFVALIPALLLLMGVVMSKAFPRFKQVQKRLDHVNSVIQENLAGIRVVKAFARHRHESNRFGSSNDALRDTTLEAIYIIVLAMPLLFLIINLGLVAALWFGGRMVMGGDIEVGALVAFVNYLFQAMFALMMVTMVLMRFTRAEASAERVNEVMDAEVVITAAENAGVPTDLRGRVEFQHVTFSYGDEGTPALSDITLTVEPNSTLAILGTTGSGKSTIVGLIPRFYDVDEGRVLVDGMDVREWDEARLRQHVSIALQESVLFSGTIRENIRFGNPEATDEEIERAARMAQAEEFISNLEHGYDSTVGQRGVNLSGGQRQRLAIARAIVRGAPILILDDSTSAVDVTTERKIQEALAELNMTVILVAQRISAVVNADNILVLEHGRIIAQGHHAELLESSEVYREIYKSQVESGAAYGTA